MGIALEDDIELELSSNLKKFIRLNPHLQPGVKITFNYPAYIAPKGGTEKWLKDLGITNGKQYLFVRIDEKIEEGQKYIVIYIQNDWGNEDYWAPIFFLRLK